MHFEREPRKPDTLLEAGLRRYSQTVHKMVLEGEETFERRLLHLRFSLEDDLLAQSPLSDNERLEKLVILMPDTAEHLAYTDDLATLQLVPIRLMADEIIPPESLTPKAIDLALNTAVRSDDWRHVECIDGTSDLRCETVLICPARACAANSIKLLHILAIQYFFEEASSENRARASDNISALKVAMDRVGLMVQPEFEMVEDAIFLGLHETQKHLFSDVTEEESSSESDS